MMKKIKVEITNIVTKTMPTRFWAAYNDVNKVSCEYYMGTSSLKPDEQVKFCTKFNFTVNNLENISTIVTASQGNLTAKNEIMNGFWNSTT